MSLKCFGARALVFLKALGGFKSFKPLLLVTGHVRVKQNARSFGIKPELSG